jgi:hypothetical protein
MGTNKFIYKIAPPIINENLSVSRELRIKLLGYLDDTTWISDDFQNLSNHLKFADEFYDFANIKISKQNPNSSQMIVTY